MIKVIFFDFDDTLYSHKTNEVPTSTIKIIKELRNKGIKVVLATGNSIMVIDNFIHNQIIFDAYITINGQVCLDENKNIVFDYPIDNPKEIFDIFNEKKYPIAIVDGKETYINFVNDYVIKAEEDVSLSIPKVKEIFNDKIYQAVAFVDENQIDEIKDKLKNFKTTRWNPKAVDIIPCENGKAKGIKKYLELMNINKEETMAFGDADNDADMLSFVSIGVAMGNATKEAKKVADYITSDIDDDGIYNAIKHFENLF